MSLERLKDDRGSISIFTAIIAIAILAAAGLAYDGSQKLGGLATARDLADNAARACAQGVVEADLRELGTPTLDPGTAAGLAGSYLALVGSPAATVAVADTECTVTVTVSVSTVFLPGPYTVTATESADALFGIEDPA